MSFFFQPCMPENDVGSVPTRLKCCSNIDHTRATVLEVVAEDERPRDWTTYTRLTHAMFALDQGI
jgi:hypothetical protein